MLPVPQPAPCPLPYLNGHAPCIPHAVAWVARGRGHAGPPSAGRGGHGSTAIWVLIVAGVIAVAVLLFGELATRSWQMEWAALQARQEANARGGL